ncbi:MAG TPA: isoprenylcysteine carboxylmethyltransferase family protein [Anaerolineae bacterium]|nr:isoprenylcysteine carboxylmethyltransferase family protein [Anaerolineae bacterium]
MTTRKFAAYAVMTGAMVCGSGAALLFAYFLIAGPVTAGRASFSNVERLGWDTLLSLLFFGMHSLMIRRTVRSRLTRLIPEHYYPAVYAIISGIILFLVVLLWQPSEDVWIRLEGRLAWLPRGISLLAVGGFIWTVRSLRALGAFDLVGRRAIRAYLRGRSARPTRLLIRGPYRHVRHPLYALMVVLLWSTPVVTSDRMLLNVLWTGWIIAGTWLEERDLAIEFGAAYREYQRAVPMLVPWRRARLTEDDLPDAAAEKLARMESGASIVNVAAD